MPSRSGGDNTGWSASESRDIPASYYNKPGQIEKLCTSPFAAMTVAGHIAEICFILLKMCPSIISNTDGNIIHILSFSFIIRYTTAAIRVF